jgi:hypothetical protein
MNTAVSFDNVLVDVRSPPEYSLGCLRAIRISGVRMFASKYNDKGGALVSSKHNIRIYFLCRNKNCNGEHVPVFVNFVDLFTPVEEVKMSSFTVNSMENSEEKGRYTQVLKEEAFLKDGVEVFIAAGSHRTTAGQQVCTEKVCFTKSYELSNVVCVRTYFPTTIKTLTMKGLLHFFASRIFQSTSCLPWEEEFQYKVVLSGFLCRLNP